MWKRVLLIVLICAGWSIAATTKPATQPTDALDRRVGEVRALFRKDPKDFEKTFHPTFLAVVPPQQLGTIFSSIFKQLGECSGAEIDRISPQTAKVNYH